VPYVVRVTIRTESGPASWLARLGGPVVHRWQLQALRGYLRGLARFVASAV